jgi:hypothetical protein
VFVQIVKLLIKSNINEIRTTNIRNQNAEVNLSSDFNIRLFVILNSNLPPFRGEGGQKPLGSRG